MAKTDERICIIGGGPAGLSAAMYLEKKGYNNYVIYEKLNKVGGKCWSPRIKTPGSGPCGSPPRRAHPPRSTSPSRRRRTRRPSR